MPKSISSDWAQTITLVLAIVAATTSVALWVQGKENATALRIETVHMEMMQEIIAVKTAHEILEAQLVYGGWSRQQHQGWVDDLREISPHIVPGLMQ